MNEKLSFKKAENEYNNLRRFAGENYPKGKCKNLLKLFQALNELLDKWKEWNENKIESHDFCMEFDKHFHDDIMESYKRQTQLKKKILRQMVRG